MAGVEKGEGNHPSSCSLSGMSSQAICHCLGGGGFGVRLMGEEGMPSCSSR